MTDLVLIILFAFSAFYFWFVFRLRRGLAILLAKAPGNNQFPFVSIVVAARNEERNIEHCLMGLLGQDYPKAKYEIIIVDDGSSDGTGKIVKRLAAKRNVRLLKLQSSPVETTGRKPDAISLGIQKSRGEVIATTDADCEVPRTWLRSMVAHLSPDVAFLSGPVVEKSDGSLLGSLASLEFLGLITTGAGLIGLGRPINCSGANLVYRKSAFKAVNGFGNGESSCDDETLMQRIFQRSVGKVHFVADARANIMTDSQHNVTGFWKQRVRWAAKRGRYEDQTILMELIGLYFFSLSLFVAALLSIFVPELRIPVSVIFAMKILVDYLSLSRGARILKQDMALRHFLIAELFHVPYIVVTGALGQFVSFRWKDRTLDR